MIVSKWLLICVPCLLLIGPASSQGIDETGSYHDLGVFSYEKGDYESAAKNFERALESAPGNPVYIYSMGKVYLRTGHYGKAAIYLKKAMALDPGLPGLKYDTAYAHLKLEEFEKAAGRFMDIAKQDPSHALANYHAGISLYRLKRYGEASGYLIRASKKSPSLRPDCHFMIGKCHVKQGEYENARSMFTKVIEDPEAVELKESARQWLDSISGRVKPGRPYSIFARLGVRYDDNVRLDPIDKDIHGEQSDYITEANFSGTWDFLEKAGFTAGAGYMHYQTWHHDLGQFDLTGSLFRAYGKYRRGPADVRLSFLPSWYWLDSKSYLKKYGIKAETRWKAANGITARLSWKFQDHDYSDDEDKTGDSNGMFLGAAMALPGRSGRVSVGMGGDIYDASAADESYHSWKAKAGISLKLPFEFNLGLNGEFQNREYDIEPDCACEKRHDQKWMGNISVSRHLVYRWLRIGAEYGFTKRDSNFVDKRYERNKTTVSLTVRY